MGEIFSHHHRHSSHLAKLLVGLLTLLLLGFSQESIGQDSSKAGRESSAQKRGESPAQTSASGGLSRDLPTAARNRYRDVVLESDNWTFRPTVLVRRGNSQGSGTIVASLEGQTLILTAAHVIRGSGAITVELHRYNLGIERVPARPGKWPRKVDAEQVAVDNAADVAIIRLSDLVALPYVARLGTDDPDAPTSDELTSVGIDLGTKLSSWNTRLVEYLWLALNESGTERRFLVTAIIPEHGRSGGGLFDKEGKLVGVCIGHAEVIKGRRMGIFSSVENVRDLLRRHDLTLVVDQSAARQARLARHSSSSTRRIARPARSAVTTTEVTGSSPSNP